MHRECDFRGMACPLPLLKTKQTLHKAEPGDEFVVLSDDPGSAKDIPAFLQQSEHQLIESKEEQGVWYFTIRRAG